MSVSGWVGFTDPFERAFSTEVPTGWTAVGGLIRHTPVDPSIYLRVVSPDRRIYLLVGDTAVTNFTTPRRSVFGVAEPEIGSVRNYVSGMAFARDYVTRTLSRTFRNIVVTGQRNRPDLTQGPWTYPNRMAHHEGGDASFECDNQGARARGIVAAVTYIYHMPGNLGGMLWSVDFLTGYVAPPERCDDALGILTRIIASTRLDPAWQQRQAAMTAQVVGMIDANTQQMLQQAAANLRQAVDLTAQIAAVHTSHADARQRMSDQLFEVWDRVISGQAPYRDSAGNNYSLDSTKAYHWVGPNGVTAATNDPSPPPGWGWERLKQVPP